VHDMGVPAGPRTRQLAVHKRHAELVLKVAVRAQAADKEVGAVGPGAVHNQAVKGHDGHWQASGHGPHQFHTLRWGEDLGASHTGRCSSRGGHTLRWGEDLGASHTGRCSSSRVQRTPVAARSALPHAHACTPLQIRNCTHTHIPTHAHTQPHSQSHTHSHTHTHTQTTCTCSARKGTERPPNSTRACGPHNPTQLPTFFLLGLMATATVRCSHRPRARVMMSKWPLLGGSNDPAYSAARGLHTGSGRTENPRQAWPPADTARHKCPLNMATGPCVQGCAWQLWLGKIKYPRQPFRAANCTPLHPVPPLHQWPTSSRASPRL
jgi:hypothetical protein